MSLIEGYMATMATLCADDAPFDGATLNAIVSAHDETFAAIQATDAELADEFQAASKYPYRVAKELAV